MVIVHMDHFSLTYLIAKKDDKRRLVRWYYCCNNFISKVKDRNGTENQVAEKLSRLEDEAMHDLG